MKFDQWLAVTLVLCVFAVIAVVLGEINNALQTIADALQATPTPEGVTR